MEHLLGSPLPFWGQGNEVFGRSKKNQTQQYHILAAMHPVISNHIPLNNLKVIGENPYLAWHISYNITYLFSKCSYQAIEPTSVRVYPTKNDSQLVNSTEDWDQFQCIIWGEIHGHKASPYFRWMVYSKSANRMDDFQSFTP